MGLNYTGARLCPCSFTPFGTDSYTGSGGLRPNVTENLLRVWC